MNAISHLCFRFVVTYSEGRYVERFTVTPCSEKVVTTTHNVSLGIREDLGPWAKYVAWAILARGKFAFSAKVRRNSYPIPAAVPADLALSTVFHVAKIAHATTRPGPLIRCYSLMHVMFYSCFLQCSTLET